MYELTQLCARDFLDAPPAVQFTSLGKHSVEGHSNCIDKHTTKVIKITDTHVGAQNADM
jgi:hypothetical protein